MIGPKKQTTKAALASITVIIFLLSSFLPFLSVDTLSVSQPTQKTRTSTLAYPNDDIAVLWERKNGSDPGFPYGGANVAPTYGMNYFGTQTVIVHLLSDYTWTVINDSAVFPITCKIYIGVDYSTDDAGFTLIADNALNNPRIRGAHWDDFPVATESHANMSSHWTALHHNDGALGYSLDLALVIYSRDYYTNYPNSWASIADHFDIIHFWFYPYEYTSLWVDFAGWETALMDMMAKVPGKEVWAGIYLHFYNLGSYPLTLTYHQLGIAGRLIKDGIIDKISILENFWIQHEPATAELVRDYLNNQMTPVKESIVNVIATPTVTSTIGGVSTIPLVRDVTAWGANNWTLISDALQKITVSGITGTNVRAWNLRTGMVVECHTTLPGIPYFFAEPGEKYRIIDMPLTNLAYTTDTDISVPTAIVGKLLWVNASLTVSAPLWINNSIVHFGPHEPYINSVKNATAPEHTFYINQSNSCDVYIRDSVIDATLRTFPFRFDTHRFDGYFDKTFTLTNSTLGCFAGQFVLPQTTYFTDSTIYQAMINGGTYIGILFSGYQGYFNCKRSLIWNGIDGTPAGGTCGLYLSGLGDAFQAGCLFFDDNTIYGGALGIFLDGSGYPGTFNRCLVYGQANDTNRFSVASTTNANRLLITVPLRIQMNISLTGVLSCSNGTIGSYSSSSGWINATINDYKLGATKVSLNPYPWTFDITTRLGYGHHFDVSEDAIYNDWEIGDEAPRSLGDNVNQFSIIGPGVAPVLTILDSNPLLVNAQVSRMVDLVFVIFAVGIVVGVVVEGTNTLRKQKMPTTEQMMKTLINMVIFIIIGIAGIGVLYKIVA